LSITDEGKVSPVKGYACCPNDTQANNTGCFQRKKDAVKVASVITNTMRNQEVRILLLDIGLGGTDLAIYIMLNQLNIVF
jgi:hypothetical protein